MFSGCITALITPFRDGKIDWERLERFVEWQVDSGVHGVVPCGTTGESPTLSHEEHNAIVERCIDTVKKRIPVIAGTGSNATEEAIQLTQHAQKAGADAALVVVPYYNKPTQAGMIAHFTAIHDASDIPIILYNVPGRTVVDMTVETVARLAELPRIIGIKDATDEPARVGQTRALTGEAFCQLSGEDATIMGFLNAGGRGIISVLGNIAPAQCAAVHNAWMNGEHEAARELFAPLAKLADALFFESSPSPAKYAASRLGFCSDEMRLPLLPASVEARKAIDDAMANAGIDGVPRDQSQATGHG